MRRSPGGTLLLKLCLLSVMICFGGSIIGCTQPLIQAVRNGKVSEAQALLSNGVDPNVLDGNGNHPLFWAVRDHNAELVSLLLHYGADPNAKNAVNEVYPHGGLLALGVASAEGNTEIIRMLLASGAAVNERQDDGKAALHQAARNGKTEAVLVLLKFHADVNAVDDFGQTPLWRAAVLGHAHTVRELLAYGADLTIRNRDGATILMGAACANPAVKNSLRSLNAGVKLQADTKEVRDRQMEVIQVLLAQGADVKAKDKNGTTAAACAKETAFEDLVLFLKDMEKRP